MIQFFEAQSGQSIYDICIQCGYPLEKIYDLMAFNNIANINEVLFGGKIINFNTDVSKDFMYKTGQFIATAEFVNPYTQGDDGNYMLRQDGTYMLRQDGNKFLRQ